MFFDYIKNQWPKANVQIGIPAVGHGDGVSFDGSTLPSLAALLLSADEKQQLANLAKEKALNVKNDSTNDEVLIDDPNVSESD